MPDFEYIVRTEGGARKTGSISAENYNLAIEKLQSQKLTVVKLNESDTSFDFVKPFLNRLSLEFEKFKNKVPLNILVFFSNIFPIKIFDTNFLNLKFILYKYPIELFIFYSLIIFILDSKKDSLTISNNIDKS